VIKIETYKFMLNGQKMRKVIGINMLHKHMLPKEYVEKAPCIFKDKDNDKFFIYKSDTAILPFDTRELHEDDFQKVLYFMRVCGTRLRAINKKIARTKWHGKETINI